MGPFDRVVCGEFNGKYDFFIIIIYFGSHNVKKNKKKVLLYKLIYLLKNYRIWLPVAVANVINDCYHYYSIQQNTKFNLLWHFYGVPIKKNSHLYRQGHLVLILLFYINEIS